jgi:hypothetical protein
VIATSTVPIPQGVIQEPVYVETKVNDNPFAAFDNEDYFAQQSGADDFVDDLTDEDRTYLRLKWGKTYKPEEWNKLLSSYARDKSKLTGMTILGRYLSKMKLK